MHQPVTHGDLFQLGRHRLICGDSSDPTILRRLVGAREIGLLFTSPPYYNQRAYRRWSSYDAYLGSMQDTLKPCLSRLAAGGVVAWLIGRGSTEKKDHAAYHSLLLEGHGLGFQDAIAWIKPAGNYTVKRSCHIRRNGFYYPTFRWETVLVYRKPGRMRRMSTRERRYMALHHTDVWEIPWVVRPMKRFGHPCVCPTEIPRRCILAYLKAGGFVLDPFGGSGTTLIAAEETGRRGLLIERDAGYCATTIRRWEEQTGGHARRLAPIR